MTICLEPPKESIAKVLEIVLFRHKINFTKTKFRKREKEQKSQKATKNINYQNSALTNVRKTKKLY